MGEYTSATIYKPMKPISFSSGKFDKLCWDLYEARGDHEKIEQIYRDIGFVMPNGKIFNMRMHFLEKNGVIYQSNDGVFGVEHLPKLHISYKFHFHDFWLGILKPNELTMNEHDNIETELFGKTIHQRFFEMKRANSNNPSFQKSFIYKHYAENEGGYPELQKIINNDDLVRINVGHIYYTGNENYRDEARKAITKQRKEIASEIKVPHWMKKAPK